MRTLAIASKKLYKKRKKKIDRIVTGVLPAVRDKSLIVRLSGIDILRECLVMTQKRATRDQTPQQSRIQSFAIEGLTFSRGVECVIHGSLLVVGELLEYGGEILAQDIQNTTRAILKYSEHKSKLVQSTVIELLPKIAKKFATEFELLLAPSITYLCRCIRKHYVHFGEAAFESAGKIALAIHKPFKNFLADFIKLISDTISSLQSQISSNSSNVSNGSSIYRPALKCIGMLACAVEKDLSRYAPQLIEQIFSCGLSNQLLKTLSRIYTHVPSSRQMIQERLSKIVWTILLQNAHGRPRPSTGHGGEDQFEMLNSLPPDSSQILLESTASADLSQFNLKDAIPSTNRSSKNAPLAMRSEDIQRIGLQMTSTLPMHPMNLPGSYYGLEGVGGSNQQIISRRTSNTQPKKEGSDKKLTFYSPRLVKLALKTLGTFDLLDINISLLHFIRQTVTTFLNDRSIGVRKQAAMTCCKLLLRVIDQMEQEKTILQGDLSSPPPANSNSSKMDMKPAKSDLSVASIASIASSGLSSTMPLVSPYLYGQFGFAISPTPTPLNVSVQSKEGVSKVPKGNHMALADSHRHQSTIIAEVLERLLSVSIADGEGEIRTTLLQCLTDPLFFTYLAQRACKSALCH